MHTITLSATDSALWDNDSAFRSAMRRRLTDEAEDLGERHVEIYADDGVTLDAWDIYLD